VNGGRSPSEVNDESVKFRWGARGGERYLPPLLRSDNLALAGKRTCFARLDQVTGDHQMHQGVQDVDVPLGGDSFAVFFENTDNLRTDVVFDDRGVLGFVELIEADEAVQGLFSFGHNRVSFERKRIIGLGELQTFFPPFLILDFVLPTTL